MSSLCQASVRLLNGRRAASGRWRCVSHNGYRRRVVLLETTEGQFRLIWRRFAALPGQSAAWGQRFHPGQPPQGADAAEDQEGKARGHGKGQGVKRRE